MGTPGADQGGMQWPSAEPPQEQTGAWTPSFDDDDSPSQGGDRRSADNGGSRLDLPTSYSQKPAPPQGSQSTRQVPPPPPPPPGAQPPRQGPPPPQGPGQTRQVPGPPPPGAPQPPPKDPGDRPTDNLPQTPGGRGGPGAAGAAAAGAVGAAGIGAAGAAGAGAAGAAGAGAAGAGAAGAAGGAGREPDLLTHHGAPGGYNYYADDYTDPYADYDYGYDDDGYGDDGYSDASHDDLFGPDEDEMSAAEARKKTIWRRVRRSCYIAAALMIVAPAGAFAYGYWAWKVEDPAEVAARTSQTVTINYATGQELTRIIPDSGERTMINDLNEVSEPMKNATLAAEDATFWHNNGFDALGILRSVWLQVVGGSGGGSTLTQQYIKLTTGEDEKTYTRKFKELVLAYKMTNEQSKPDILKAYLNTAYYGRGANGIHAAAKAYFNKAPNQLNPYESAVLAGMVQRPTENDPAKYPEQGRKRWEFVIGQMSQNRFITKEEYDARQLPQTRPPEEWRAEGTTGSQYHIRKQVMAELEREGYTEDVLSRGGYTVTTNIDPVAQQAAENAVNKATAGEPQNLVSSLVAVEPKSGAIKAYYGGGTEVGGFDYAASPQPPGSSFKPFVALAGLEKGRGIGENYNGTDHQFIAGTVFANARGSECKLPPHCGVREAMNESVNTVFVNMAVQFGASKVRDAAYQAGIPKTDAKGKPTLQNADGGVDAGIALGQYPVRTMDMASSYSTFANEGKRLPPRFVSKVSNSEKTEPFGQAPAVPAFSEDQAESKNLAANVVEAMLGVADYSKRPLDKNRPVAAKTGTHQLGDTQDNQNAWMVGTTPQLATAVSMLAEENGKVAPVRDSTGKPVFGSGLPGEIWQDFMNNYHRNLKPEPFPKARPIGQFDQVLPPPPSTPSSSSAPPTSSLQPPTSSQPSESSESSESESTESTLPGGRPTEDCGIFGCSGGGGGDSGGGGQPNALAPRRY